MGVTVDSVLVRDTARNAADLDGQVVVLDAPAGAYVSFNAVASEIWSMLSKPCRVADIFASLSEHHDVDDARLSRDVLPFLDHLVARRLAHYAEPSAGR